MNNKKGKEPENDRKNFVLIPSNTPNEGILFIDHSQNGRSGHLGHALVEYEDDKILAFYPNCSDDNGGHSAVGWMEYKRSEDGGQTWSKPIVLDYSKKMFEQGNNYSAMSEKAVVTSDGTIVLFNLLCDISNSAGWEPYLTPTYIRSFDGGQTWSEAKELSDKRGRIYDAIYHEKGIYVLEFCNDATETWTGTSDEHVYQLYVSQDNGETFTKKSELPFITKDRGYGTMEVLENGDLIVYIYNINDEYNLEYVISKDNGNTWSEVKTSYLAKKIRNPQIVGIGDFYFMHGRSGNKGEKTGNFVLYSSIDGKNWDQGQYLRMQEAGLGAYSNNLVVGTFNPEKRNKLLIQASHAYKEHKTNICHWWVENIRGTNKNEDSNTTATYLNLSKRKISKIY